MHPVHFQYYFEPPVLLTSNSFSCPTQTQMPISGHIPGTLGPAFPALSTQKYPSWRGRTLPEGELGVRSAFRQGELSTSQLENWSHG